MYLFSSFAPFVVKKLKSCGCVLFLQRENNTPRNGTDESGECGQE